MDNLHRVIVYDLFLKCQSCSSSAESLPWVSHSVYTIVCTALSVSPLYKMKPLSLLIALQATHLTQSLPLSQAQAPNDILAAGVQSLPLSSKIPDATGVRRFHLAHR